MKKNILTLVLFAGMFGSLKAQTKVENLILITTDGLRWQEVFNGIDTAIANNKAWNQGAREELYKKYWDEELHERRLRIMPFLWSTIQTRGQIYGNRELGNKVDVANPYSFSFPGYSELITGYGDENVNSNEYPPNPHVTVLEYLHKQPAFKNKVAVFGSWTAYTNIVNEERSGIPVFNGYEPLGGDKPTEAEKLMNLIRRDMYKPWGEGEAIDALTHYAAMEYLKARKPRVMQISFGETDVFSHGGKYRDYLTSTVQFDKFVGDLWNYLQTDPQYKNKTALIITTDHGRGNKIKAQWRDHGQKTPGSNEIWIAVLAPGIPAKGEVKKPMQLHQQQVAQTIAKFLGQTYSSDHPIAPAIKEVWEK